MGTITSANVANAIVKLVAVDALPALVSNLVMGNLVNRDYEPRWLTPEIRSTCRFLRPWWPTTSRRAARFRRRIRIGKRADCAQHARRGDVSNSGCDEGPGGAGPSKAVHAAGGGGDRGTIESDILNLYSQFSANTAVGTAGVALTEAIVDQAETALFQAKVPSVASKYLVVDPVSYSAMRQIPRFSEYYSAGDAGLRALVDGAVGKIKDFFVFRSQLVPLTGSGPVNTHNLAFARDAIGLVIRRLPQPLPGTGAIAEYAEMGNFGIRVVMSYQPNTLGQQFTVDVLYGTAVLQNSFGVQVNS